MKSLTSGLIMLFAKKLSCIRGERLLFKDVDLEIGPGSLQYILGENGSGKSSLLRILAGLLPPEAGSVYWHGQDIRQSRQSADSYDEHLLYIGHLNAIKEDLSARENLALSYASNSAEVSVALRAVSLEKQADIAVRHLSQGQRRRVALARLWLEPFGTNNRLWILDEPFASLDTAMTDKLTQRISQHLAAGGLTVLTTHQAVAITANRTQTYRLSQ
jgi:heme exporter protein A